MPSDFPGRPSKLKGALVIFEAPVPIPTNLILFQYNPESMSRSIQQPGQSFIRTRNSGHTARVNPPMENIHISVELDAADQLETSNRLTITTGLHPALAALELLLYPPSAQLILGKVLSLVGSAFASPPQVPMVLFVWGPLRVLPVRMISVSIVEQAYDQLLNPIQAKVDLSMRTLTEKELKVAGPPFDSLALVMQIAKEALARTNVVTAALDLGASISF